MNVCCRVEEVDTAETAHGRLGTIRLWMTNCKVGESPQWHVDRQALYWVDVRAPQLLQLQPDTKELTRWDLPDVVGAMALWGGDKVLLAMRHTLTLMDLGSGHFSEFVAVETSTPHNRLNDGKVSPTGRWFVFGSMDDRLEKIPTGALYRADRHGVLVQLADGITVTNGIAWNLDATVLYFSDSFTGELFLAPWNEAEGEMGTPVLMRAFAQGEGRPDGGVVDLNDRYWSAGVSAGRINCLDADGTIFDSFELPCRAPTMCAFGGNDMGTMFVTSLVRPQWGSVAPADGALLSFNSPAPGCAPAVL